MSCKSKKEKSGHQELAELSMAKSIVNKFSVTGAGQGTKRNDDYKEQYYFQVDSKCTMGVL